MDAVWKPSATVRRRQRSRHPTTWQQPPSWDDNPMLHCYTPVLSTDRPKKNQNILWWQVYYRNNKSIHTHTENNQEENKGKKPVSKPCIYTSAFWFAFASTTMHSQPTRLLINAPVLFKLFDLFPISYNHFALASSLPSSRSLGLTRHRPLAHLRCCYCCKTFEDLLERASMYILSHRNVNENDY